MTHYQDLQDSPARRSPEYLAVIDEWNYLWDVFIGVRAWSTRINGILKPAPKAKSYLPQHPAETDYEHRFRMTEFDRVFAAALTEYVDLLFANGVDLNQVPDWLMEDWATLSDRNATGQNFLAEVCLNSLIFGISHIFVDFDGDRPRWIPIDPRKVINWEIEKVGGVETLSMVAVETYYAGEFIVKTYRKGGHWSEVSYRKLEFGGYEFGEETTGQRKAVGENFEEIPLIPVPISYYMDSYMVCDRQFRTLADKNITLYQVTSDYRRKMQLCNTPQPIRYDPMSDGGNVDISPTSIMDLKTPDAYFQWSETNTDSLAASRTEMMDLRDDIAADSTKFLKNPTPRVSAGASANSIAPVQSSLISFSNLLVAATMQAMRFHAKYLGRSLGDFSMELVPSLKKNQLKDSQFAFSVQTLVKEKSITRHSAIKLLNDAGFLPDEIAEIELNLPEFLPDGK